MIGDFPENIGFSKNEHEWTKSIYGGYIVITQRLFDQELYSMSFVNEEDDEFFILMKGTPDECLSQMKIFERDEKISRILDFDEKNNI